MNPNEFLTHIRAHIARDELAQALQQLQQFLAQAPQLDELLQQSGRFAAIRQQIRLGTVSQADATLTQNQIRDALLDFVRELEVQGEIPELRAEVERAVSFVNSKNVMAGNASVEGNLSIGDTIGRQTNMGASSSYYEDNRTILSYSPDKKPLYIMIANTTISEVKQNQELVKLQGQYGNTMREWRPFNSENIEVILGEFEGLTNFKFTEIVYLDECEDIDEFMEVSKKMTIFIFDGLTECDLSQSVDATHDEIAGFLLLVNENYDEDILALSETRFKHKWRKYYTKLKHPCLQIEIKVSSKEMLFRRLTNFAKLSGIDFSTSKYKNALKERYNNSAVRAIDSMGNNRQVI